MCRNRMSRARVGSTNSKASTRRGRCRPAAQFTFASVWASWSAWSFCSGGVQMRVRACNIVRGFSCLGPNREVQPCEELRFHPSSGHKQAVTPEPAVEDEATNICRELMDSRKKAFTTKARTK
ncbi:hypothetical protein niasHT_011641 [Heterodera trifolii]|uniref:Secreted protein n=1 Tax=Heterodera trifolii TaxID=157864 RepID=A0ABD2LH09_9BILA